MALNVPLPGDTRNAGIGRRSEKAKGDGLEEYKAEIKRAKKQKKGPVWDSFGARIK